MHHKQGSSSTCEEVYAVSKSGKQIPDKEFYTAAAWSNSAERREETHAIEVPTQRIDLEKVNPDRNIVDGKRAVCSHDTHVPDQSTLLVSRQIEGVAPARESWSFEYRGVLLKWAFLLSRGGVCLRRIARVLLVIVACGVCCGQWTCVGSGICSRFTSSRGRGDGQVPAEFPRNGRPFRGRNQNNLGFRVQG